MCFYSDDYPEFSDERVVTARKSHRCGECRSPILAGQSYLYNSGKFDGGFFVHKICRRCCYDIVRVVEHELAEGCHWSESWPPLEGLVEYLEESEMGQTRHEDVPEEFRVGDAPKVKAKVAIGAVAGVNHG